MLTYEPGFKGPIDAALLRYFAGWMRNLKQQRKHLDRIYHWNERVRVERDMRVVDAEIRTLRHCIKQIHWSRDARRSR